MKSFSKSLFYSIYQRIKHRIVWWPIGIFPIQSRVAVRNLIINGRTINLQFPEGEDDRQQWEFSHLYIDDPYGLRLLPSDLGTILDIGGNIGIFSILARHYFPNSTIASYEPNPKLASFITANTQELNIIVNREAIGAKSGFVNFVEHNHSLNGQVTTGSDGSIALTSFSTAVQRLGNQIDLLKIDCEGGEWDILQDTDSLKKVRYLALEYHLLQENAKPLSWLIQFLNHQGFRITSLCEAEAAPVGQLTAINTRYAIK